jgi:hypothetical protein
MVRRAAASAPKGPPSASHLADRAAVPGAEERVLGELQLAFVLFAVGHAYDAFQAWKNLVSLLCGCCAALRTRPALFAAFAGEGARERGVRTNRAVRTLTLHGRCGRGVPAPA